MIRNLIKDFMKKANNVKGMLKNIPQRAKTTVSREVQYINNASSVNEKRMKMMNQLLFFASDMLIILIIFSIILHFISFGYISGDSMNPTYQNGERFVSVREETYEQLNVITFRYSDENAGDEAVFIKRVIAKSGDTIYARNNTVYVNGKAVTEQYSIGSTEDFDPVTLKDGEYFVMGDNRENSYDSRSFGVIKDESIIGKVVCVW